MDPPVFWESDAAALPCAGPGGIDRRLGRLTEQCVRQAECHCNPGLGTSILQRGAPLSAMALDSITETKPSPGAGEGERAQGLRGRSRRR